MHRIIRTRLSRHKLDSSPEMHYRDVILMVRNGDSDDGYFDLFYRDGWAYLAVHPPGPRGTPVYHDDIRNRMRMLGVPRVDPSRVREISEQARGVPEPLVEWPEGERLASRSSFLSRKMKCPQRSR